LRQQFAFALGDANPDLLDRVNLQAVVDGVSLPSQLIKLGLVDEYLFVIGPVIAGEGRRLLDGVSLPEKLQLKLVESKILKSGCVALRYLKQ
jgi:riboflavin biosynthesis pyrimidine reductase